MEEKSEKILSPEEWKKLLTETFRKFNVPYYPTLTGPLGIKIDFCRGARVYIPESAGSKFNLKTVDLDSGTVLYNGILEAGDYFVSQKKYFVNCGVEITEYPSGKRIWQHKFDAKDRDVLIQFPVETLGDTLAWFNPVVKFQRKHQCNVFVRVAGYIRPLLESAHPELHFVSDDEINTVVPYAAYTVAIFHDDAELDSSPVDYRTVPLHHYADEILGTGIDDKPPAIEFLPERKINDPYVCIASQASGGAKLWNHPTGWDSVVKFLKDNGYRVIDIDRDYISGKCVQWNRIPREAEDFTGNHPLTERAALIYHADFFIGLGSGLSWLSWCVGKPTVLVSGFSRMRAEFPTPYRIANKNVCHGCFNDVRCRFDHHDYMWCPRHKGTPRHWECSRGITAKMVIDAIKNIPEFQKHKLSQKNNGE